MDQILRINRLIQGFPYLLLICTSPDSELREYPHPLATMLVFLFTSILLLGLLYTYTAGVHPIHYYTAWARIAIALTATFLLLFHWVSIFTCI